MRVPSSVVMKLLMVKSLLYPAFFCPEGRPSRPLCLRFYGSGAKVGIGGSDIKRADSDSAVI
jgi:hypothetical protein